MKNNDVAIKISTRCSSFSLSFFSLFPSNIFFCNTYLCSYNRDVIRKQIDIHRTSL